MRRVSIDRMAEYYRSIMGRELPGDEPVDMDELVGLHISSEATFGEFLDANRRWAQIYEETI